MPTHYLAIVIGSNKVARISNTANTTEITSVGDRKIDRSKWEVVGFSDLGQKTANCFAPNVPAGQ